MDVYVDVIVNDTPRGIYPLIAQGDQLWATATVLADMGIKTPPGLSSPMRLDRLPGVKVIFDAERQQALVEAEASMLTLPSTILGPQEAGFVPATVSPAALLNYDLYGIRQDNGARSLSLFSEFRAFAGNTVFSTTGLGRMIHGVPGRTGTRTVRLDTSMTTSFQESMLSLTIGDTLTRSLGWSRSARVGGVRFGRDFDLQPYRPTVPLPEFFGSATVPSDVELYINGLRHYTGKVPAGPFQLNVMPGISSAGTAQIVLTDALGRSRTMDFALYDSQGLLQKGLTDWSVELGFVREQYGLKSFSYGSRPVGSASVRHGISSRLTAEAHFESTKRLLNAGAGLAWAAGRFGILSGSLAGSQHEGRRGHQWSVGYRWTGQRYNFGASVLRANATYRDIPALSGAPAIREQLNLHAGYMHPRLGSVGLSFLKFRTQGMDASRYGSVYWFKSLGQRASLNLNVSQNLNDRRDRAIYLGLTLALDGNITASTGLQREQGQNAATFDMSKPVPMDGGWGWRVNGRTGQWQRGGQVQADYLGRYGQLTAGMLRSGHTSQVYGGASGSLVLMGGRTYPSRRIDDGFAVVSTSGVSGVPVQLENRPVGVTDRRGYLLVAPVHAYRRNRISIDSLKLPADVRINTVAMDSVPSRGAGNLETFGIMRVRAANVRLSLPDGRPLPVGTTVRLNSKDADATYTGYDGIVYLEGLQDNNTLIVEFDHGGHANTDVSSARQSCVIDFVYDGQGRSPTTLGPLICKPEERS